MIEDKASGANAVDRRRLDGLQMGRGIAATLVAIDHAILYSLSFRPQTVPMLGAYGVTLFFLISGFIMVKVSGKGTFLPGRFLLNRFERIAPLYYIACGLLALQVMAAPQAFRTTHLEFWHVLRSLLFIPAYSPTAGKGFITPFYQLGWTLNFEMFFYTVFASLFFLRSTARVLTLSALLAGLIIIGQIVHFDSAIPKFYTRIDLASFLVGALLGLWSQRGGIAVERSLALVLFVFSLVPLVYVALHFDDHFGDSTLLRLTLLAAAATHIFVLIGYVDRLRLPVPRWLLALGDASYSIYLFHLFAIGPIAFVGRKLGPAFLGPSIMVAIIAAIATGLWVYRWIEKPIMEWIKRRRCERPEPSRQGAPQAAGNSLARAGQDANLT